jgi:peptide/nickel transport system ATP-binding protein
MTAVIEIADLNVWFSGRGMDAHAVRGVDLTIGSRERIGLVGESGCGKSTTILAMMGLLPPSATVFGRIVVDGVEILAGGERAIAPHRWTTMAMVFQGAMNSFNPVRRIHLQIADAIHMRRRVPVKAARARALELLAMVGISGERATGYPHEFSGGMRQRAAIALALSCEPKLLLADEPTTALDVMVQAQIMELLDRLCDEQGLALVLVSHDLPLVSQVCRSINVMYAGEIVERGPTERLYEMPRHPYTELLFAATPDIGDSERELVSIAGSPPALDQALVGCPFRPRCDRAFARCESVAPALQNVGEDHSAACHLNDEDGSIASSLCDTAPRSVDGAP